MKVFLTSLACRTLPKIVSLLNRNPREMTVAFIPTAADTYEEKPWLTADRDKLIELGFKVADFDIKEKNENEIFETLKVFDVVFVAGGNSFYLLSKVRESGFDVAVKRLLEKGIVYIGSSAGQLLWA